MFLLLFLLASPALACTGNGISFDGKSTTFILILESLIVGATLLIWFAKKRFFPAKEIDKSRKFWLHFFVFWAIFLSVGIGLFGSFGISAYQNVYKNFGVNLPFSTLLIVHIRHSLWLLAGMTVIGLCISNDSRRYPLFFATLCIATVMLFVWAMWALNLPIFLLC